MSLPLRLAYMISSPPEEAEHIRGKTLTPESPKPVHYPSPSNIPILGKSMDPLFHETAFNIGTPASFQSFQTQPQTQTPSAQSSSTFYPPQQSYQNAATGGAGGVPGNYTQSAGYSGGYGAHTQDTSIHSFPSQNQSAPSYSEAQSTTTQDHRAPYSMTYDPNSYPAAQRQAQPAQGSHFQSPSNGDDNLQALLGQLSPHIGNNHSNDRNATPSMPSQPSQTQGHSSLSSLPAAANLPPRPPAQDKSTTHKQDDDIRNYHPHSQKPSNSQYSRSQQLQPLNVQVPTSNNGHSHPASRSNQTPNTPSRTQRESVDCDDDEDARWPPEINRRYEQFLEDERKYVTDGQWDMFPLGSRLFIGNLPSEKVTKRDVFHRFHRHGQIAQISIKQAYGFVQFLDAESCRKALDIEQGQTLRGRKIHLEISKPQRNTKKADTDSRTGPRRRSRSPDYTRGGTGSQGGRSVDRYPGNAISPRERDFRRGRDDYRPGRSPSPRGRGGRRDRSWDRYDGRRRSRSRSPVGRGAGRYRSPTPPQDDLPLPHRPAHEVPDVQVIVVNDLPREFIAWVEDTFRQRGIRIDVLILSPRLSEEAVVRRQILEGVVAIVKLNPAAVTKSKINLTVFDRRGSNVTFAEYADLDPTTAAMLVLNKKQNQAPPAQVPAPAPVQYGQPYAAATASAPSFAAPQPPTHQYPPTSNANLTGLLSTLDANSLQQLLGVMAQNNLSQQPQPPATGLTPDLARLLGSISAPPQQPPTAQNGYQNPYANLSLASMMNQPPLQQSPATTAQRPQPNQLSPSAQPDMHEIMAQLAKYQR